jgi:hypothetical protein
MNGLYEASFFSKQMILYWYYFLELSICMLSQLPGAMPDYPDDKNFIPIRYSGFWDVPCAFFTEFDSKLYLFFRPDFNEEIDDYPPNYEVYICKGIQMHKAIEKNLWHPLDHKDKVFLGEIPTKDVVFDHTHREFVNISVFGMLE